MIRRTRRPLVTLGTLGALGLVATAQALWPVAAAGQNDLSERSGEAATDEWTRFGSSVVGTWEAEDSRHIIEWGVGNRILITQSYFPADEGWTLVSEGIWYWDPSIDAIRGTTVATGMPVELFQYVTRMDGDDIVHHLVAFGPMGGDFVERWRMEGEGYTWTLEQDGEQIMGGRYRRVGR